MGGETSSEKVERGPQCPTKHLLEAWVQQQDGLQEQHQLWEKEPCRMGNPSSEEDWLGLDDVVMLKSFKLVMVVSMALWLDVTN